MFTLFNFNYLILSDFLNFKVIRHTIFNLGQSLRHILRKKVNGMLLVTAESLQMFWNKMEGNISEV